MKDINNINLKNYIQQILPQENSISTQIRNDNYDPLDVQFQTSHLQLTFLSFLLKMIQCENLLEIGTFKGYSTIAFAQALPDDGRIITCEKNTAWLQIAQNNFKTAKVEHKIKTHLGCAKDYMQTLLHDSKAEKFDFIYIDADKANYGIYYELALKLVKTNGLIAIDNILWKGKVADNNIIDKRTNSIRDLNAKIKADKLVEYCILPIEDGLTLVRKKN